MRILYLGDIVGRSGRDAVGKYLPELKTSLKPNAVIANGENSAHGFGLTPTICEELHSYGVDIITTGNHVWDRKELIPHLESDSRVIRPLNYPDGTPGVGHTTLRLPDGKRLAVVQVLGQVAMLTNYACPFEAMLKYLEKQKLGQTVNCIIVDFHADCTAEKTALGRLCDGRVTAVIGSHTHIPTADSYILNSGTAYITDAGMCGDYDSIIGFQNQESLARFLNKRRQGQLVVANGEATLCGLYVESNDEGLAVRCEPVRCGGKLSPQLPQIDD